MGLVNVATVSVFFGKDEELICGQGLRVATQTDTASTVPGNELKASMMRKSVANWTCGEHKQSIHGWAKKWSLGCVSPAS